MRTIPLAIIGAGPAGMAAAATAARYGLKPVLFDEQPAPGGQIYRALESTPLRRPELLGEDYWHGKSLVQALRDGAIDYRPGHTVWQLNRDGEVGLLAGDRAELIRAERIVLATGAQERPFPIPGWTLPGVMGAGAAQVLLKTSGVAAQAPLVLAGSGPLLYLVAAQYSRAGAAVAAILETTPRENFRHAAGHIGGAVKGWRYLRKGLSLLKELKRAGIRHEHQVTELHAEGNGRLQHVRWRTAARPDVWQQCDATTLLLHHGVVPNVQMTRALGGEHDWSEAQLCWCPRRDSLGRSDIEGFFIAGDGGGIGGAKSAALQGELAALAALASLDLLDDVALHRETAPRHRALASELAIRPFLDALYRPGDRWRRPADEVIVCRCEEVSAGEVRRVAKLGCSGPNQMKSFTRCGMGPCQGRLCGLTVSEILAEETGQSIEQTGYYRLRPPFKPITLGQMASAADGTDYGQRQQQGSTAVVTEKASS
ncbi:FAD/NAD(P)-dependent oxidoreductase [Salinicola rhizosphaerae]|uniref:Pyridine nucleotide-disulfide oxidoreductase n=1 Tax=Salinicola rhizosphaerae TaxID=1443141 RepID=A0ABQ3E7N7_9GAMM|nr:NAD(P)/FAD-dependent oxidoreductase [Salinicola rhizosphaerae]GHB23794.1 pyridine nucleotide-disulfide oxidoreductase [Salinicola rhizosphaerae]